MATVYKEITDYLSTLLKENDFFNAEFTVFDLEQVGEFAANNPNLNITQTGLFSSPNDSSTMTLGGKEKHIIFRTWYIRFHFKDFSDRLKNEEYVEKLQKAIFKKTMRGQLPKSDSRKYQKLEMQGSAYPHQRAENNEWALYSITLRIAYID